MGVVTHSMFDPFQLFQLPLTFDINLTDLDERFRRLQQLCHPDRASSAFDREAREKKAGEINQAYGVLKCPLKRGYTLLELLGVKKAEETLLGPDFLMKIMEFQEEIMEGKLRIEDFKECLQQVLNRLSEAFQHKAYDQVQAYLQEYQFLTNLGNSTHALATS